MWHYYRRLDSMPIRTLALLMLNLHPIQVEEEGLPDQFDWEDVATQNALLVAAVNAGTIGAIDGSERPATADTNIVTSSAVQWLRTHSHKSLADRLDVSQPLPSSQRVKRKALIETLEKEWPTIESDLKRASANGLHTAKCGGGFWEIETAREWAQKSQRLVGQQPEPKPRNDLFGRN